MLHFSTTKYEILSKIYFSFLSSLTASGRLRVQKYNFYTLQTKKNNNYFFNFLHPYNKYKTQCTE